VSTKGLIAVSQHEFSLTVSRETGAGTTASGSRKEARRHVVSAEGKPAIHGSSAKAFHGEVERWNPEELFLAALAQCHLLSLLYVTERDGLGEIECTIHARATLDVGADGAGRITTVTLEPHTRVLEAPAERVIAAHAEAEKLCFIANSVSCEVVVIPRVEGASAPDTQA
jgi:organic hydroperoxide reductase OsmC/OhrA